MTMKEWAENEVRIVCERDNGDIDCGYRVACYKSALNAYKSLCDDGHSGTSFHLTMGILDRLMRGRPLSPIEDTPDVWCDKARKKGLFQCKRKSSLFKQVNEDGTVSYNDVDRVLWVTGDSSWHSGLADSIVDKMYPIEMPYYPEEKPFRVYGEEFLSDKRNGDFDHVGVFYVIKPDGEREEINRFFDGTGDGYTEITKEEYLARKAKRVDHE